MHDPGIEPASARHTIFDLIGIGYHRFRRPDSRIAAGYHPSVETNVQMRVDPKP